MWPQHCQLANFWNNFQKEPHRRALQEVQITFNQAMCLSCQMGIIDSLVLAVQMYSLTVFLRRSAKPLSLVNTHIGAPYPIPFNSGWVVRACWGVFIWGNTHAREPTLESSDTFNHTWKSATPNGGTSELLLLWIAMLFCCYFTFRVTASRSAFT